MGLMTKEVRGMDKVNDYSDYSYLHEIIEFLNLKTIFHNQAIYCKKLWLDCLDFSLK